MNGIDEQLAPYEHRLMGLIPRDRFRQVRIPRPSADILARFRALVDPTPTIADILDAMGVEGMVAATDLPPIQQGTTVVGPALTLRYVPERTAPALARSGGLSAKLADRDLYAIAEPGDVAVFDAGGAAVSCMGGLSATVAARRQIGGAVVWGGVRDVATIRRLGVPVWSRAVTPRTGKFRLEAIEINGPVTVAGVVVQPGDLVVADDTGVVFIPADRIEEVLVRAEEATRHEEAVVALVEQDAPLDELRRVLPPNRW